MNSDCSSIVARVDDPASFAALAALVRDWEPSLELDRPPTDALLYEPDGTLYAVCLAETMEARAGDRCRTVRRGDLLVVPQAFAIDAGPIVDLLVVRHDGAAPDHFRERFIQVWGFEHLAAPPDVVGGWGLHDVVTPLDVRFRLPYAVLDVNETKEQVVPPSGELRLILSLRGAIRAEIWSDQSAVVHDLGPRTVLGLLPGAGCRFQGIGRLGVLTLLNDVSHSARRATMGGRRDLGTSPEFTPA